MSRAALADRYTKPAKSFGRWLLAQTDRGGLIGQLAAAAGADRDFPRDGTAAQVRARLQATQATGDMFEALDDAELAWPGQ